ncbi:uracil-DNA glycosylase-like [Acropora millepora]|uniref:uracil-DNA glycosylase-like n=1 Tax=Acropora millepora TaxID=45264 RepID=UPI001CF52DB8|nr:uracil-DNA glycosylase-like [Acropora millepora]
MPRTSLVAAVLLFVLIANHTDCSTSKLRVTQKKIEKYCMHAKYISSSLEAFAKDCAPKTWSDFFGNKEVLKALALANEIRGATKEITALEKKKNKVTSYQIEPSMQSMFEAFKKVSPGNVKVVILGQDPTPQVGKATGRAFSVKDPRTVGSAMNVLLEVALEGWSVDLDNGDLSKWEKQGVLLLNSALTIGEITYQDPDMIIKTKQVSHLRHWSPFTKLLIEYIDSLPKSSVWMLWGNVAQDFAVNIKNSYILKGGHPSSLGSVGAKNTFFAGSYFYCANEFLLKKGRVGVDWGLRVGYSKRHEVNNKLDPCPPITNINKHLFLGKRKQRF